MIKLARTAKKMRADIMTGPNILSVFMMRQNCSIAMKENEKRTEMTWISPPNHGNSVLVDKVPVNLKIACDEHQSVSK